MSQKTDVDEELDISQDDPFDMEKVTDSIALLKNQLKGCILNF